MSSILLSILPRPDLYTATKFNPEAMVRLLQQTHIPDIQTYNQSQHGPPQQQQRYDGTPQLPRHINTLCPDSDLVALKQP